MPIKKILFFIVGFLLTGNVFSQTLSLQAKGTSETETKIIDSLSYKKTFGDFASLQQETIFIKNKLDGLGYLESELSKLDRLNDSTFIAMYDLKYRYKRIRIYFEDIINRDVLKLIAADKQGNFFEIDIPDLEATLSFLNTEIANQGDPFSTLQLSEIKKKDDNLLEANLMIAQQTNQRTIDSIIVKGYEKFPKSYIKHYLKIKNRQPFNLKTIRNKTSELENLIFANQIKEPEVLFTKDSTLLYIYVEKQQSNSFDGFLGFGTNTDSNKLEFDGYLNLNLINNLNYGESFSLIYKSDENEQKTFDISLSTPYLFGSPLGAQLNLNIFKKDSTFVTVSQAAKINYQINPKNLISTGISSITSTNLLDVTSIAVDDYRSVFYIAEYLHIKRQRYEPLFPINFRVLLSAGFGSRTNENLDESQQKLELNCLKIFNLNQRNSVFIRVSSSFLNSDTYFDNELLRFGGINSIRGFEENSLTANLFSVLNTEYRYKLNNTIYVHSVLDGGYFENQMIDAKGKLFGFGFGFGLLTKAGLFKFNYSNGKSENQPFKFSDSKIHISLTANF